MQRAYGTTTQQMPLSVSSSYLQLEFAQAHARASDSQKIEANRRSRIDLTPGPVYRGVGC